jgi:TRAP-type C4-dicarboxylate transport system substrate-binding protein
MKKGFIGFMVTVTVVMMIGGALWVRSAKADTVVLKFATVEPPQSFNNQKVWGPIFEKMNKDAEGIFKVEIFAGGTLGRNPMQTLKILMDGVTDLVHAINAYLPGQLVDDQVANTPFTAKNSLDCTISFQKMQERKMLRGYDELVVLGQICLDQYGIHTKFPVKVPADLKGKKMRTAGKIHHALAKACGATPVAMPITKVAESISRGVIVGTFSDWNAMQTFRINDVARYHCLVPFGTTTLMVAMTKKKYESLPPKGRAVIDKYRGGYFSRFWAEALDEHMVNIETRISKDPKHTVYTPNAAEMKQWQAAIDSVVASWSTEHDNWDTLLKAYKDGLP